VSVRDAGVAGVREFGVTVVCVTWIEREGGGFDTQRKRSMEEWENGRVAAKESMAQCDVPST
jgi:hypothetical protein